MPEVRKDRRRIFTNGGLNEPAVSQRKALIDPNDWLEAEVPLMPLCALVRIEFE